MKIFIIYCLLFIHVNMCIFIRGFRVSIRVSGIRGFGFGDGFPPESVSGSGSGFDFGFRFRVSVLGARRLHPIRTRPVAILTWKSLFQNKKLKRQSLALILMVPQALMVFPLFFTKDSGRLLSLTS